MAKAPTEIRSLARKHTEEAIERLAYWMRADNPKASVSASAALLDRGWGKAVQTTEMTVRRITAKELPDDELAAIAVGGGDGADAPPIDPAQLN